MDVYAVIYVSSYYVIVLIHNSLMLSLNLLIIELEDIISNLLN